MAAEKVTKAASTAPNADKKRAIEIINGNVVHRLDYGKINGRPFFCTCGMGFDAFVSMKFAQSGHRGLVQYARNTIGIGLTYRGESYEIETDKGTERVDAFLIACANASQYGNNAYIAPDASMKDGLMDVIIMSPINPLEGAQVLLQMFTRTLPSNSHVRIIKTRRIRIVRQSEGAVHCDGDPLTMGREVTVELVPDSFNVVVNPAAHDKHAGYLQEMGGFLTGLFRSAPVAAEAPAADDANAIDALIRKMLHDGADSITLQYNRTLTNEEVAKLTRAFTVGVKRHCEQMYNSTSCRSYSSGKVLLTFSSTACDSAQLKKYREETLARAILVHDALWESGYLTGDMTQYELARAYYVWLCNNCVYDEGTVSSSSLSHLAYSALVDGVAVCDGYTGAYDLLLRLEGIECTSLFNDSHIWTLATLDGTQYHIDVTWGDQYGRTDLRYFGMSEEQSYQCHPWGTADKKK